MKVSEITAAVIAGFEYGVTHARTEVEDVSRVTISTEGLQEPADMTAIGEGLPPERVATDAIVDAVSEAARVSRAAVKDAVQKMQKQRAAEYATGERRDEAVLSKFTLDDLLRATRSLMPEELRRLNDEIAEIMLMSDSVEVAEEKVRQLKTAVVNRVACFAPMQEPNEKQMVALVKLLEALTGESAHPDVEGKGCMANNEEIGSYLRKHGYRYDYFGECRDPMNSNLSREFIDTAARVILLEPVDPRFVASLRQYLAMIAKPLVIIGLEGQYRISPDQEVAKSAEEAATIQDKMVADVVKDKRRAPEDVSSEEAAASPKLGIATEPVSGRDKLICKVGCLAPLATANEAQLITLETLLQNLCTGLPVVEIEVYGRGRAWTTAFVIVVGGSTRCKFYSSMIVHMGFSAQCRNFVDQMNRVILLYPADKAFVGDLATHLCDTGKPFTTINVEGKAFSR